MSQSFVRQLHAPLLCIVGPTASGKSDLAQQVAQELDGVVLSADSMQIYTGMDIGTGKVLPQERMVEHLGLDIVTPDEPYSAQRFQAYGRGIVEEHDAAHISCVVCGGTGFYVRALIDDYQFPAGEQVGNAVRDTYTALVAEQGCQAAWDTLERIDPASAAVIEPNDSKRVIRALELAEQGESYAEQKRKLATLPAYYPVCMIGLEVEPDVLRKRIDSRVDSMIELGLLAETQTLVNQGLTEALTASCAIGYSQMIEVIEGHATLEEAVERIKIATHQYAKRQRTWFRKDMRIQWLDANDRSEDAQHARVQQVLDAYKQSVEAYQLKGGSYGT